MKCPACGSPAFTSTRVVRALSAKIPDILADGLEEGACGACGETCVTVPRARELTDVIAAALIAKRWRLAAGEVRFLRTALNLRAEALAETLGVTASQLSRWENAASREGRTVRISATADRLLRLLVAQHRGLPVPDLRGIDARHDAPLALTVRLKRAWGPVEAPAAAVA